MKGYWAPILMMVAVQVAGAVGYDSLPALSPHLLNALQLTEGQIGLIAAAAGVGGALVGILGGLVVDMLGVRRSTRWFAGIMATSFAILTLIPSYYVIIVAYFLIGTVYSSLFSVTNKGVLASAPPHIRGIAFGLKQSGVLLGGALAALVIGVVGATYSWQWATFALALVLLVLCLPGGWLYVEPTTPGGTSSTGVRTRAPWHGLKNVLKHHRFIRLCLAHGGFLWLHYSMGVYFVLFFQNELGFPNQAATFSFILFQMGGIAGRLWWGWLTDKIGEVHSGAIVGGIGIASILMVLILTSLQPAGPNWSLMLLAALAGSFITGWNGVLINNTLRRIDLADMGVASSVNFSLSWLGTIFGVAVTGYFIESLGYRTGLRLTTLVALAAIIVVLREYRNDLRTQEKDAVSITRSTA